MLLAAQFPLADLRPFLADDARRLRDPWTFVRHVGLPDVRHQHRKDTWPWTEQFWTSKRAILFPDRLDQLPFGPWRPGNFRGAFRRLFWTEKQLPRARLEFGITSVGYRSEPFYGATRGRDFDGGDCQRILLDFLRVQVGVSDRGELRRHPLSKGARPVAQLLLQSTTQWKGAPDGFVTKPWWVQAGLPLVLVEYGFREQGAVPTDAVTIDDAREAFTLHLYPRPVDGSVWPVWLLGVRDSLDPDLRRIRLHLTRLHAEVQTLGLVLDSLGDEEQQSCFASSGPRLALLDIYLDKAFGTIDKAEWYGGNSAALFAAAREYIKASDPSWDTQLTEKLERAIAFRPHLARLLREKTQARKALYIYRTVPDA